MSNTPISQSQIIHEVRTAGLPGSYFPVNSPIRNATLTGDMKNIVVQISEKLHNDYNNIDNLGKRAKVVNSTQEHFAERRSIPAEQDGQMYDATTGSADFQAIQPRIAETVNRQLFYRPEIYGYMQNYVDVARQSMIQSKDGLVFDPNGAAEFLANVQRTRSKLVNQRVAHAMDRLAARGAVFSGVDDLISSQYIPTTAVMSNPTAGGGITPFNPNIHMTAPAVPTDIMTTPALLIKLLEQLQQYNGSKRTQAGGTFYAHKDLRFVIEQIKKDPQYTNYFSADFPPFYDTASSASMLREPGYIFKGSNIRVVFVEDLGNSIATYDPASLSSYLLLNGTIDTRTTVGYFVRGTELPITVQRLLSASHEAVVPMGNTYSMFTAEEYFDMDTYESANLVQVKSWYRMNTTDRVRGAQTLV
jgi:hypothetical protein